MMTLCAVGTTGDHAIPTLAAMTTSVVCVVSKVMEPLTAPMRTGPKADLLCLSNLFLLLPDLTHQTVAVQPA